MLRNVCKRFYTYLLLKGRTSRVSFFTLLFFSGISLSVFLIPSSAKADFGQITDSSQQLTVSQGTYLEIQPMGTGLTGTMSGIQMYNSAGGGGAGGIQANVQEYSSCADITNAVAPINTYGLTSPVTSNTGKALFTFTGSVTFDPTKCYAIEMTGNFGFFGGSGAWYGSATSGLWQGGNLITYGTTVSSGTISNGQGSNQGVYNIYFNVIGGVAPPVGDNCTLGAFGTCIDTVTPYDSTTTATSTSFSFASTGYVSTSDYVATSSLGEGTAVHIQVTNNEVQSLGIGVVPYYYFNGDFPLSGSGSYSVGSTTDIEKTGDYTMTTSIVKPWFSFFGLVNIGSQTIQATTTQFTVATSSVLNILGNQVSFAVGSATTYESASTTDTCNINLGSLDNNWFASCSRYLFFPQTICQYTDAGVQVPGSCMTFGQTAYNESQTFLTKQPWGYATLLYNDIASTTGTSTLPSLSFTFPAGQGLPASVSGVTLNLTPWNEMAGPGSMLATKTVPETGTNILSKFLEYWNFLWILMFSLYVLNEFYGAWKAGDFAYFGSTSSGMDKGITTYRGLVANRQRKQYRDLTRMQDRINRNT